jgi:hypothetical protein
MPKVTFSASQKVEEFWACEVEVPQEIIDKGLDAVKEYIRSGEEVVDYIATFDSQVLEELTDIDEVEVVTTEEIKHV